MLVRGVVAFVLSLQTASTSPLPSPNVVHEARPQHAQLSKRGSTLRPDAVIPIKLALTQSGLEDAYDRLMNVSHPDSVHYGQHLSLADANAAFAPAPATVAAARAWLAAAADIPESRVLSTSNGWLAADLPVSVAERVFSTRYYEHQDRTGNLRIGCDSYSLPAHLQQHVDYVVPGVKSSPPLRKRSLQKRWGGGGDGGGGGRSPPWGPPTGPVRRPPWWNPPGSHPGGPWQLPPAAHGLPPDLQDCGRNITPGSCHAQRWRLLRRSG